MYKRRRISFFYTSTNRGDITSRRLVSLFVIVLLWLFFVSTSGSSYLILAKNQQQIMALSSPPSSSSFTTTADTSYTINNIIPSILCDRTYGKEIMVLEGASLIDGTGAPLKSHVVIVINGSKIVTVTSESEFHKCYDSSSRRNSSNNNNNINNIVNSSDYTSAVVLNLTGKYIIPGLFDMHAHVAGVLKEDSYNQSKSEKMLSLLLANGVTTIRNPGGPTEQSVLLKQDLAAKKIKGPQIFTAGRLINTPQIPIPFVEKQVNTEEDLREEIRHQASSGVDYIKLYVGLPPNLVKVAIKEAHSHGIKVIGHLYLTSWTDAANFGIDALTHGVPVSPFLLSKDKQQIFYQNGDDPFNHFLWLDLVDLNSTEINQMIKALVKNKVSVDPTLNIYDAMLKDDQKHQHLWYKVLRITEMLYDNGIKIMSGTDIPNFGLVPGLSLHHELELLVKAGIKPLDVITIATKNGAEALGIANKTGTIVPGKEADMIILTANPANNISNTKNIEAVIDDGKIVDRKSLLRQD